MSGGDEGRTPGAGQQTGGAGENGNDHPNIIPETIPADAAGTDQKDLLPDTPAALDFLDRWCGSGQRVLTSIPPGGGRTTTATFTAEDRDKMAAWIDERQGRQNIYFTVNEVYGPVNSKPNKGAVSAIRALHVDVDPRAGEPIERERERAWTQLRSYHPAPSVIIDSGGGLQAFWLSDREVPVGGSAELARLVWRNDEPNERGALNDAERVVMNAHLAGLFEAVEGRNFKVEADLQADNCHNAERIMRLVGTVNVPGKKKAANLRTAADEGNIVANIFLLKARHQYREGEALEANLNVSLNTGGVLVVPNKMSMEEFLEERRRAGELPLGPRTDKVERIPGQRDPETIEGVLDPETRRSE